MTEFNATGGSGGGAGGSVRAADVGPALRDEAGRLADK